MPVKKETAQTTPVNAPVSDPVADRLQKSFDAQAAQGVELNAIVEHIAMSTAGAVYGENATNPEREVVVLTIKVPDHETTFTKGFSMPMNPASWKHPMFALAGYVRAYGHPPKAGDQIKVTVDGEGFYQITLG